MNDILEGLIAKLDLTERWIEFDGDKCPVNKSDLVEVRLRGGHKFKKIAGKIDWWRGLGESRGICSGEVIAYRRC